MLGEIADTVFNIGKGNMYMNSASCEVLSNLKRQMSQRFIHSVVSMMWKYPPIQMSVFVSNQPDLLQ